MMIAAKKIYKPLIIVIKFSAIMDQPKMMQAIVASRLAPPVWKNGMAEWAKAETVDELKSMFTVMPPIPPVE